MPDEEYIESILIRKDGKEGVSIPTFDDADLDELFEFEGTVKLVQIIKAVQNKFHNQYDYIFKIQEIKKLKRED